MTGRMATDEKVLLEKAVSRSGGASGPPASLAKTTPRGLSGIGCTKAKQANAMIVTTVAQLLTKLLLISTPFHCKGGANQGQGTPCSESSEIVQFCLRVRKCAINIGVICYLDM